MLCIYFRNVVSSFNCVPAAKIGIAIAVCEYSHPHFPLHNTQSTCYLSYHLLPPVVIFILFLCCCKIAQRRRVTAANLAYIQNQPQPLPPVGGYPPSPYAPGVYNGTPLQPGQAYVYAGPQQYQPPPGPPPAPPYDPSTKPAYDPTNAPQYPPPTYSKDGSAAER